MNYPNNITNAINKIEKIQRAAITVVCAESVLPVVLRLAKPETQHAFAEGLDVMWKSVETGEIDSRSEFARKILDDLPESNCDDSHLPEYDIMTAISILAYALDTLIECDPAKTAKMAGFACTAATNYYSGYDTILAQGTQPKIINPKNPPPPGPMQLFQMQTQVRLLEAMQGQSQLRKETFLDMHTSALRLTSELESAFPIYAKRLGWKE